MSSRQRRHILLTIPKLAKLQKLRFDRSDIGLYKCCFESCNDCTSTATVANTIMLRYVECETSHPASRMLMQENQKRNNLIAAGLKKFRVMP